jgi:hypothetical protein
VRLEHRRSERGRDLGALLETPLGGALALALRTVQLNSHGDEDGEEQ